MHIFFVRAFLPQLDSRMTKYAQALVQKGVDVSYLGWQRDPNTPVAADANTHLFRRPAALGGRWGNVFALLAWNWYVFRQLFARRKQVSAVHAVDLDSGLAAYIFCRLCRKPLVFDLYDHYADTRSIGGLPGRLISSIERMLARRADLTLLADVSRYTQHGLDPALPNVMVIENVPRAAIPYQPLDPHDAGPIRIGYLGVFEPHHRGLEHLLTAFAGQPGVELHFAGYGPLASRIQAAADAHPNVKHHGPVTQEAGLTLLTRMHCTAGFYYLTVPNHRYAAPNKYYEHLLLGRPLLTTRGTPPGDKVEAERTGWSLDETVDGLRRWREQVTMAELAERGARARACWTQRYQHYSDETLGGQYYTRLTQLTAP